MSPWKRRKYIHMRRCRLDVKIFKGFTHLHLRHLDVLEHCKCFFKFWSYELVTLRDVNKTWKEFCQLQESLFNNFARSSKSKPRYDVTIKTNTKNFNPFYRLTVRRLGKAEVQNFTLKFTDGPLTVTTSQHKIYASSGQRQDIDKLIKNYVPLSKIL